MSIGDYDVWYDPNEVDAQNRIEVLRTWARPDLDITIGSIVRVGDDEIAPLAAWIRGYNDDRGIITLELILDAEQAAVA